MKTTKFLFVSAFVAILSVSCDKENELIEKINNLDSTTNHSSDSTSNQCADSTITLSTDSIITQNPTIVSNTDELATQTVNLSDFTEVELKKIGEVEINKGSAYKVEVTDYKNLLPYAKVYLEGKRLVVSYDDSKQVMGSKLKITITIPDRLSKTIVSGAGNVNIRSGLASDSVQLVVSGAGNISAANINSRSVNIEMPGSGVIEAKGTTGNLTLRVKGSGTIRCKELMCTNANCDISGVSTVFLSATNKLKVNAMGIGSLTYYGTPIPDLNLGKLFSVIKG